MSTTWFAYPTTTSTRSGYVGYRRHGTDKILLHGHVDGAWQLDADLDQQNLGPVSIGRVAALARGLTKASEAVPSP